MISPKRLFAGNWKDELWLMAGGLFGGSLYFFTENTALGITQASNVAFIICTAPLLTTILSLLFYKSEKATKGLIYGSILALIGVGLVVDVYKRQLHNCSPPTGITKAEKSV